jgi:hypothetical protein
MESSGVVTGKSGGHEATTVTSVNEEREKKVGPKYFFFIFF